ncbi:hypothetical protein P280DRAFT_474818 [Massarina eburnea CBS 473.64]|uniref:ubiquitinyl hydrolase 1 n=1 Tax=Massarina eburnea CBS 473.64 TaxID=1395130 RepID=A0A6A6RG43_9PLEO|nr:hypothetical protein P280DRAFT_474818 [Massarina eburnea CBS 473.64]
MDTSRECLLLQYNHAVLPRNLPGAEEVDRDQVDKQLLARLHSAVLEFSTFVHPDHKIFVTAIQAALDTCRTLNVDGTIEKDGLLQAFSKLGNNDLLILHVTQQNAGLLVYWGPIALGERYIIFEAFEASAVSETVLAASGSLQWDFPGQAAAVPEHEFFSNGFHEHISSFLQRGSFELIQDFAAITYKAGAPITEVRDTSNPALVTTLLMTILSTVGKEYHPPTLRKRVRDTVSFHKALKPWRRSPFYLVIRVAIQRHLYAKLGARLGRLYYKLIMCLFLTRLMEDCLHGIPGEAVHFLKTKIGRRLAKVEMEMIEGKGLSSDARNHLLDLLTQFGESLSKVGEYLQGQWERYKQNTKRRIYKLHQQPDPSSLRLQLKISGPILDGILKDPLPHIRNNAVSTQDMLYQFYTSHAKRPFTEFTNRYREPAKHEDRDVIPSIKGVDLAPTHEQKCYELATTIDDYVETTGTLYDNYPDIKSQFLLNLMELWVEMDKSAVACYGLLARYHPGIESDILDTLHVLSLDDMKRARAVQSYIASRCSNWIGHGTRTIFDPPREDSFATIYFDQCEELGEIRAEIEARAEQEREEKVAQWIKLREKQRELVETSARKPCLRYNEVTSTGAVIEDKHSSECFTPKGRHYYIKEAESMRIKIYEHPLPESEPCAKAVVFELACPTAFAKYRDATWLIFGLLAHPSEPASDKVLKIRDYSRLEAYFSGKPARVTLASTPKSYLQTHYANVAVTSPQHRVCRECPLVLQYYDSSTETWTERNGKPSFSMHFPLNLPQDSPYKQQQRAFDTWPSSNAIIANQVKCPADVSVLEYSAWQSLLVGSHSRWLVLLRELGSSNLNFSTDSTWAVVTRLALQLGPASSGDEDWLRNCHSVFHDPKFCRKLIEQIGYRLEAIRHNWKEPIQLDLLITMLLKVGYLASSDEVKEDALELLHTARIITCTWCAEIRSTTAKHASVATAHLAMWASLLCKRTFYIFADVLEMLDTETLAYFVEASITLQEHLTGNPETLHHSLKNAFLNDWKFSLSNRDKIRKAILASPASFKIALQKFWPVPDSCQLNDQNFTHEPHSNFLYLHLNDTDNENGRYIHWDFLDGSLLVDGEPLGILPSEYHSDPIVRKLIGDQIPHVRPSSMSGMSVVIDHKMPGGNWLHFGHRANGNLVVRATQGGSVYEYIPEELFQADSEMDLPAPLIQNCYHWLNLRTGRLEIRQDDKWKLKNSDTTIDLFQRLGWRRGTRLIDPMSPVAQAVYHNFNGFERPDQIILSQTRKGRLCVELKCKGLTLTVNKSGWLQSHELAAEITNNQDIGTWHGLRSKLVVQSTLNRRQRSVLVSMNNSISCRKDGTHVIVDVAYGGAYLKFGVNDILGRLECPAEPRMLYSKARLHAFTSHYLPDRLTGRTGCETALDYLQSGSYKPWTPLEKEDLIILLDIANLTPTRNYYPQHLKSMEVVHWRPELPVSMQDDRYRPLVETICQRSADLVRFHNIQDSEVKNACGPGNPHLEHRALSRSYAIPTDSPLIYQSRDRRTKTNSKVRSKVAEICGILCRESLTLSMDDSKMASQLEAFPVLGGYVKDFDLFQFSDLLSTDLGLEWGSLNLTALNSKREDPYRLMFLLAPMSLSKDAPMELIKFLLALSLVPEASTIRVPKWSSYTGFKQNYVPSVLELASLMQHAKRPFDAEGPIETGHLFLTKKEHNNKSQQACLDLAASILTQWPNHELKLDTIIQVDAKLLDQDIAMESVMEQWSQVTKNYELSRYLREVKFVIDQHISQRLSSVSTSSAFDESNFFSDRSEPYGQRQRGGEIPKLADLLRTRFNARSTLQLSSSKATPRKVFAEITNSSSRGDCRSLGDKKKLTISSELPQGPIRELQTIVERCRESTSEMQRRYGREMEKSIEALARYTAQSQPIHAQIDYPKLSKDIADFKMAFQRAVEAIDQTMETSHVGANWLRHAGLWPRMTPIALLKELRSTSGAKFGVGSKNALLELALAITKHQRLLRIEDALVRNKEQQLLDERTNVGHQNWDPSKYVDWVLLEIDGNIAIRPEQVEVAEATIAPESGQNSVLQLLMGKGKTSCILPMVASVLANKRQLFRIVVPRALLLQSAQVMQAKLGSLLDREFLHIPFSRKTPTTQSLMETYNQLHRHMKENSGIVLTLPEHIMSFKLSGVQRLCDESDEASILINTQTWLEENSRDVLDECDVSLAIRTQLIYPSGSQMAVDGHPLRWQTIQAVLREVEALLPQLQHNYPQSIQVVLRSDGYPTIYFLRKDAEDALIARLALVICKGQTSILPTMEIPPPRQDDIHTFVSSEKVTPEIVKAVAAFLRDRQQLMKVVFLLRGLLVHRILLSTLKKRWNVQYGLHPQRDPIAVPYSAKGVPSDTAEFGHPDVSIILTCLSFYYDGITLLQLKQAFEHLLKSDEPSIEYEKWTGHSTPGSLRDVNSVDMENEAQLRELHRHIRYNQYLLEFFLNNLVFPKHAKQFKTKLQASGWDVVLYNDYKCQTTGFSGTNDARHQLPMTIKQHDLPQLAHTNAEVLSYLLEPRNREYWLAVDETRHRLTEEGLLAKLSKPYGRIRILIDAGAQILEHDNHGLITKWLEIDTDALAGVYFDRHHKPWVRYRNGKREPLVASLFADNMERCLVYLDESHCRGTDLKLPITAKAALTLGPHLTKDALAQAAMRLRLLGKSQSVVFIAPPEVHQAIVDLRSKKDTSVIDSADVIRWLLQRACTAIEQLEPLFYNQGIDYVKRLQATFNELNYLEHPGARDLYLDVVRTKELQTLKELYEPKRISKNPNIKIHQFHSKLQGYVKKLLQRRKDFQDIGGDAVQSAAMDEVEQEREIEIQIESVREVQKPIHVIPRKDPKLHKDIKSFVLGSSGTLQPSSAWEDVWSAMATTGLGLKRTAIKKLATKLHVSTQFTRTVVVSEPNDDFLRPVSASSPFESVWLT